MKMEIINPLNCPRWDELVLETKEGSFFHSLGWAMVLQSSYNYNPAYFALSEGNRLLALIPIMEVRSFFTGKRGVSLTFTDYCEPIVEDQAMFPELFDHIVDFGRKSGWKYIELRGGRQYLPDAPVAARYVGHTLALCPDEKELVARFRSSNRRNIQRAIQEGVEVKACVSLQSVREFYQLHCLTRKRHGLPPQPFRFFKNVHEFVIARGNGFVFLASCGEETVAGAICFHFGNRALYKFGASDERYHHVRANNLVMWEAIRWYALNGYASFCFGRTSSDNDGLRQFKNGWGGEEKDLYYFKYDLNKGKFSESSKVAKPIVNILLQKAPITLLKVLGALLYEHIG